MQNQQQNQGTLWGMFISWLLPNQDSENLLYKQTQVKNALQNLENNDLPNFVGALEVLKKDLVASNAITYIEAILNSMPKDPHGGYLLEGFDSLEDLTLNNTLREEAINSLAKYANLGSDYCERLCPKRDAFNLN